ncbi:unnamed protein product, partial [Phaeothamnion confervicola]
MDAVREFFRRQGLDESIFAALEASADALPRFVRLRGSEEAQDSLEVKLRLELGPAASLRRASWLSDGGGCFLALTGGGGIRLCDCPSFRSGEVAGIDASSGFAVLALAPQPGDDVLDLCCSPGGKLIMIADMLHGEGSVTGVDIAADRLRVCRQLVLKSFSQRGASAGGGAGSAGAGGGSGVTAACCRLRLFEADGRFFDVGPGGRRVCSPASVKRARATLVLDDGCCDSTTGGGTGSDSIERSRRRRLNKSGRARERRRLRAVAEADQAKGGAKRLYDRVLVDAECTHDGSLRHLLKSIAGGTAHVERTLLDPGRLAVLQDLQRSLIRRGFSLLRPGGTMVYSTCSQCESQNDDIVEWLLSEEPAAELVPIDT